MKKHILSLLALVFVAQVSYAVTQSYYSSIEGKKGTTLRDELHDIVKVGPQNMSYNGLWTAYATTDVYPQDSVDKAGKIWDMYSNVLYTYSSDQCGQYNEVGDCYNREHSVPASWFGDASPAYYDIGHIVPTDGYVNNQRSNFPFGECENGKRLTNGTKRGAGKLGSSTFAGYTSVGTVFEPDDQYKGDFARIYMYMAVRYKKGNDKNISISSAMFNTSDANYGFTNYSVALLMKWHRMDPVSVKEILRNNGMETVQSNRNPFIDYPILAEYLWGNKAGETFSFSDATGSFEPEFIPGESDGQRNTTDPTILSPKDIIDLGSTNTTVSKNYDLTVKGINLTEGNLTLEISGSSYFSLATTTVSKANALNGYNVTITYAPKAEGNHSAKLTINGCGVSNHQVTITGSCVAEHTITWISSGLTQYTTAATNTVPPLPNQTPADCSDDRVFIGWTAQTSVTDLPSDLFTTPSAIDGPKTYYAVYADKESTGGGTPTTTTAFSTTSLGSKNSVTTGYTVSATAAAKSGYYQDGSGTTGVTIYNPTTPMFTSTPSAISLTVSIGAGSGNLNFSNYVYATLVDGIGTAVGTAVEITNHVTTSTGDSYTVSIPTTGITSANGIYLYHTKESGKNIRYFSASLSITTGGGSTTYSNYSTACSSTPTNYVTVTFHKNDGTNTTETQQVPENESAALTANPWSRDNYTFNGWNTKKDGTGVSYTDGQNVTLSADLDLYAQWTEVAQYTVTFMNNGSLFATKNGPTGSTITDIGTPSLTNCEGYTFECWSSVQYAADNTDDPITDYPGKILDRDTTYYAVYAGSSSGETDQTGRIIYHTTAPTCGGEAPECNATISIHSNNESWGSVSFVGAEGTSQTVSCGTTVTILASPNNGYRFVEWSDFVSTAQREVELTSDSTLTARFEESTPTIIEQTPTEWQSKQPEFRKVLINNQLFILRENKLWTITGQEVK